MTKLARPNSPARLRLVSDGSRGAVIANADTGALLTLNASKTAENPVLVKAYERFRNAKAEVTAAQDALEWLADEWRHRWPLAPEQILGGANADSEYGSESAERDIIGRFIYRETACLTKRLSRQIRNEKPALCFSVETTDYIERIIANLEGPRTARTPSGLVRKLALQEKTLAMWQEKIPISQAYYAEIARLKKLSGVEQYQDRLASAQAQYRAATLAVATAHAFTVSGIAMKAEAIKSDAFMSVALGQVGILGDMARFIHSTLEVLGTAT